MEQRIVAEGLISTVGGQLRLVGGRSKKDGRIVFPMPQGAEGAAYEAMPLSSEGKLWSYTVQRFPPKSPPYAGGEDGPFKPFAVGYVELPGQVIVESRIEAERFEDLRIGAPMRLALSPFRRDGDGADVLTFVFRPA